VKPTHELSDHVKKPVILRFRGEGDAYKRAQVVADALGLSMEEYLYQCVREGHRVLQSRQIASGTLLDEREIIPAFARRDGFIEFV